MKQYFALTICTMLAVFTFCTKQVTKQTVTIQKGHEIITIEKKDTTAYVVAFADSQERAKFTASFEKMLKQFPFDENRTSSGKYFYLKSAGIPKPVTVETQVPIPVAQAPEKAVEKPAEKIEPKTGGTLTLYAGQEYLDNTLLRFVCPYPFGKDVCGENVAKDYVGLLDAKVVSDKQIDIIIKNTCITATGQRLSSFDIVNAWTAFVKKQPAEGLALFRNVKGIDGFITGREAVINGFVTVDEKTISLRLSKPDFDAMTRLCTRRLLPVSLKLGLYAVKAEGTNTMLLAPNLQTALLQKPFLASCALKLGKDANPFLAFSLNKYDCMTLYINKDLEYARKKNQDKADLVAYSENRYFLSCPVGTKETRIVLKKLIDSKDILANFVKAEGEVISMVESDASNGEQSEQATNQLQSVPTISAPLSILYRHDDPVSCVIAQKIFSDFSRTGLQCVLKGADVRLYELALVGKEYGVAIGFVDKSVLTDKTEKFRLSTIWFSGVLDEHARIAECNEIPLFTVKQYLLCKKKIVVGADGLESAFINE